MKVSFHIQTSEVFETSEVLTGVYENNSVR
jgi:hypothetical protein